MGKVYFISDLHFGHKNIIKYENRPFSTLNEMVSHIIKKWNEVVTDNDKVFVLGDVSFLNKEATQNIVKKLKGRKILIKGNHDKGKSDSWWRDVGFSEVIKYPIFYSQFYILSHSPMYAEDPYINIHGHVHGTAPDAKNYFNVGAEKLNYTPISFDDIKEIKNFRR